MIINLAKVSNPLDIVIDVILKEARKEDRLVKQLLYTGLSAYTSTPLNLAVNAPSGEGKSHTISRVMEKFPEEDVITYAGMTDKALFHRHGILVMKNEKGHYESVEERLLEIDGNIADKESELSTTKDHDTKQGIRSQIKILKQEKRDIQKDTKKLIKLGHKILVFMDTPSASLFAAIMTLLSHDKYEVEYEYADSHNGIKTKSNVLQGWPVVIFAQAIDYSDHPRFAEIQRRFIVTNPKMSVEKYKAGVALTSIKYGMPDFIYQSEVVSDEEKDKAKEIVMAFKDRLMELSGTQPPGKQNVFVPFNEAVGNALPSQRAFDMTTANRFFWFMSLLPIIKFESRPCITYRKQGSIDLVTVPFAVGEDLKEAMFLMEYANGVRPYILEWYNEVFLAAYLAKTEPSKSKNGEKEEKMIALTTTELAESTYEIQHKKYSTKQILENFVKPLVNQSYLNETESDIDHRANIFYPVLALKQKKLFDSDQSNNILDSPKIPVRNITELPTIDYITSKIEGVLKYSSEAKVFALKNAKGEVKTAREIAQEYYSDIGQYFEVVKELPSADYPKKPKSGSVGAKGLEKYSIQPQSNTLGVEKEGENQ